MLLPHAAQNLRTTSIGLSNCLLLWSILMALYFRPPGSMIGYGRQPPCQIHLLALPELGVSDCANRLAFAK